MSADFFEQDVEVQLDNKAELSNFLDELIHQHRGDVENIELTYIFCSDKYLIDINNKFLDHDTYTDIITFDLSEGDYHLISEIYISSERVKENANKFNVTFERELYRVIFHGALHLCGFKDKTETEEKLMREMEEKCLTAYLGYED